MQVWKVLRDTALGAKKAKMNDFPDVTTSHTVRVQPEVSVSALPPILVYLFTRFFLLLFIRWFKHLLSTGNVPNVWAIEPEKLLSCPWRVAEPVTWWAAQFSLFKLEFACFVKIFTSDIMSLYVDDILYLHHLPDPRRQQSLDTRLKFYLRRTVSGTALILDFNSWIIISLPWQLETWSLGTKARVSELMEIAWTLTEWGYGPRIECPGWRLEPGNKDSECCEVRFWVLREKHDSLGEIWESHSLSLECKNSIDKNTNPNPRWMALASSPGNHNNTKDLVPEDYSWPEATWHKSGSVRIQTPGYSGCEEKWLAGRRIQVNILL